MASKINLSSANPTEEEKQTIVEALRQKLQGKVKFDNQNQKIYIFKFAGIKTVKNINTDEDYLLRWLYSTEFDVETSFLRVSLSLNSIQKIRNQKIHNIAKEITLKLI